MTAGAWVGLVLAAAFAVGDWVAVARDRKPLELLCKPAVIVGLLVAAVAIDPTDSAMRAWFVAALVLSLVGDVFLMLPERPLGPADTFTFGLASFLLGHLAYIAGFAAFGTGSRWSLVALVLAVPLLGFVGTRVVRGARADDPALGVAVTVYMLVLVAMLLMAWSSGLPTALVGSALFVGSDAMIGWSRFVRPFPGHRLAIIVTYHVAQGLLVLSLLG